MAIGRRHFLQGTAAFGAGLAFAASARSTPDPTAIATIGLALAAGRRAALLLLPIPLVWLAASGLTLQTMGESQAWLPFAAVAATPLILAMRRRP